MALSGLILILLGLVVLGVAAIGVAGIVMVVVLATRKKADKPTLDNRDQPPGY